MRSADCIGGRRDFRDQNDAEKLKKEAFQEAEREGVNGSLVRGKTCRGQNRAEDGA